MRRAGQRRLLPGRFPPHLAAAAGSPARWAALPRFDPVAQRLQQDPRGGRGSGARPCDHPVALENPRRDRGVEQGKAMGRVGELRSARWAEGHWRDPAGRGKMPVSTMPVPLPSFGERGPGFGFAARSSSGVTEIPRARTMAEPPHGGSAGRSRRRITTSRWRGRVVALPASLQVRKKVPPSAVHPAMATRLLARDLLQRCVVTMLPRSCFPPSPSPSSSERSSPVLKRWSSAAANVLQDDFVAGIGRDQGRIIHAPGEREPVTTLQTQVPSEDPSRSEKRPLLSAALPPHPYPLPCDGAEDAGAAGDRHRRRTGLTLTPLSPSLRGEGGVRDGVRRRMKRC